MFGRVFLYAKKQGKDGKINDLHVIQKLTLSQIISIGLKKALIHFVMFRIMF